MTRDARHAWLAIGVPVAEVPVFDAATLPEADVHVATWFPTVVPVVRARRARKIFHFCQGYEAPHPHTFHRLDEIDEAYRQNVPKLLVSAHLEADPRAPLPGAVHVLPQAIPAASFAPSDPQRDAPRKPPTVGVVGPFEAPMKGIAVALGAVARLREAGRDVRLYRASALPRTRRSRPSSSRTSTDTRCPPTSCRSGTTPRRPPLPVVRRRGVRASRRSRRWRRASPSSSRTFPSFAVLPDESVSRVPAGDASGMAREAARLLDEPWLWATRRARGLEIARTFSLDRVLDRLEEIFGQKTS